MSKRKEKHVAGQEVEQEDGAETSGEVTADPLVDGASDPTTDLPPAPSGTDPNLPPPPDPYYAGPPADSPDPLPEDPRLARLKGEFNRVITNWANVRLRARIYDIRVQGAIVDLIDQLFETAEKLSRE